MVFALTLASLRLPSTDGIIVRSYAAKAAVWSPSAWASSHASTYAPYTARLVLPPTAGPGQ